jgi:hypothetical protein
MEVMRSQPAIRLPGAGSNEARNRLQEGWASGGFRTNDLRKIPASPGKETATAIEERAAGGGRLLLYRNDVANGGELSRQRGAA